MLALSGEGWWPIIASGSYGPGDYATSVPTPTRGVLLNCSTPGRPLVGVPLWAFSEWDPPCCTGLAQ